MISYRNKPLDSGIQAKVCKYAQSLWIQDNFFFSQLSVTTTTSVQSHNLHNPQKSEDSFPRDSLQCPQPD